MQMRYCTVHGATSAMLLFWNGKVKYLWSMDDIELDRIIYVTEYSFPDVGAFTIAFYGIC